MSLKVVTESKLARFWQGVKEILAEKSDDGHKHSAADLTSGVLSVERGGTGYNTVDTAPTNGSAKMVTSGGIYTALTQKAGKDEATQNAAGLMSANDKSKLDGIAAGANAYTHPTTAGNKHIPSGGASGQILRWSSDGTAVWGDDEDTTYSAATQSAQGLMSASDKAKLDGFKKITATVDGLGWSSQSDGTYTQTVTATGVTASNNIIVGPVAASETAYVTAGCKVTAQAANSITLVCNNPQDSDLTLDILILPA